MSLRMTTCHYYAATGVSGINSGTTRLWLLSWVKVPTGAGGAGYTSRGLVQVSAPTLDSTQTHLSLMIDGSNEPGVRYRQAVNAVTSSTAIEYWRAASQDRWTVQVAHLDTTAPANQMVWVTFGRAAATAVAATESTKTGDVVVPSANLTSIFVGRNQNAVVSGSPADAESDIKLAEFVIGQGALPTLANIQSVIDGTLSPADLPGAWEHWRARNATDGLVGRMRGITLAPFGGSATTTFDDADNPTVADPAVTPAPVLSSPSAGTPGTTSITIQATSDRASDGTMRFLRRVGGSAASAATIASTGESQAATANPQSRTMTGFTAGSANNFVDMVQVGAGGNSNVVTAGPFTMAASGPVITGPSGAAGAASSTANVAENATTGPTFSTSMALGVGFPTVTGPQAANWTLTALSATSWRLDPVTPFSHEAGGLVNPQAVTFNASASVSQSCSITITDVIEPPLAPTIGTATAGNATVSIAFTAPVNTGRPAIIDYTATITGGITKTGTSSPIVFTGADGVVNGTAYTGTVTARNDEGTGPSSAASNSVTPSADSVDPVLTGVVTFSAITPTSATASWPAGTDNVGVVGYERRINGGSYVDVGNNLSAALSGLTPATLQAVDVRAYDAVGRRSSPPITGTFTTGAVVTFSATVGPFGLNTGSGQRPALTAFEAWVFPVGVVVGGASPPAPTRVTGTLNGSGLAVLSGLPAAGIGEAWFLFPGDPEVQRRDRGTARAIYTAA